MRLSAFGLAIWATFQFLSVGHAADPYDYATSALQGDLSGAEAGLAAGGDDDLETLAKFRARFLDRTDGLKLKEIKNRAVRDVAAAYQEYWRDALLDPARRPDLELALIERIRKIVDNDDSDHKSLAEAFVTDAELVRLRTDEAHAEQGRSLIAQRLVGWIEDRGYQALTGRTQPFLELMVWTKNRKEIAEVALTDGVFSIPITYQEDFIVGGWAYFATFEHARSGGWANADGLFVVADAYDDLNAEDFQISFLKHEARHFADATKYPKISGADREYRAKLTELIYAQESMKKLLAQFARGGARIDVAHPLANWHVSNDLAVALYVDAPAEDWWTVADPEQVRAAARTLLARNSQALDMAGAETAEGVIRP